jgi:hypothetical protein
MVKKTRGRLLKTGPILAVVLLLTLPCIAQRPKRETLVAQRLFQDVPLRGVQRVVQKWGSYLVLEAENHRIVFLNSAMQVERQIGNIGQDFGELYYPNDLAVDPEGYIYVRDSMNRRFQVFEWNGKEFSEFPNSPEAHGLAVTSKGEILLGQPQKNKLVSVYTRDGKLVRSFGELHKLSDFYGPELSGLDNQYKHAINRVKISVDKDDNVYLGFIGAPVFQKYNASGELLFEKKIAGPQAAEIINGFRKKRQSPVRRGMDDVPTPLIITGLTVDDATGNIYIAFQWNRAWVYAANKNGDGVTVLDSPLRELLFQNIALSEDGRAILAARLSVVKTDEAYMFTLPATLKRR